MFHSSSLKVKMIECDDFNGKFLKVRRINTCVKSSAWCFSMSGIRVALAGVGNCASALVQGAKYYAKAENEEQTLGLKNPTLGGYRPCDIEFVCAFDIETRKVGVDLSKAILFKPNNTLKFFSVPNLDVQVMKGPVLDGLSKHTKNVIKESMQPEVDVAKELKRKKAEILVNLLPSGAVKATQWYAEQALAADCAFINTSPVFVASKSKWAKKFENANLPLIGDDLADQIGSTAIHKTLLKFLSDRGVHIDKTYQLDVGGGTESLNTLDRTRELKRAVKTHSVESVLSHKASVVAGSTDFVDFLENRRDSFFWIKGFYFGKVPILLDLRLSTVDAPNVGSVLFDVIRAAKIALDRHVAGPLLSVSAVAFKHPPKIMPMETAEKKFKNFVLGRIHR